MEYISGIVMFKNIIVFPENTLSYNDSSNRQAGVNSQQTGISESKSQAEFGNHKTIQSGKGTVNRVRSEVINT